jgi:D-tyrosyl-tRNA(Tyr) deacylase
MRAVVQRVSTARVLVDHVIVGEIGRGLLVLVGVTGSDGPEDVAYIAGKVRELRLFPDDEGKMNRSLADVGGAALVVSQFTLFGDCRNGRRPSFTKAAPPADAKALYEAVVAKIRETGVPVSTGVFQADMQVELTNDGPVTLLLDSSRAF